jgi:hypothetical protein
MTRIGCFSPGSPLNKAYQLRLSLRLDYGLWREGYRPTPVSHLRHSSKVSRIPTLRRAAQ